jgi:hypothetical protein
MTLVAVTQFVCYNLRMAMSETLSVRLNWQTRRVLAEAAPTHDAAGASALARDILEHWAAETLANQTRADVERASAYLRAHAAGWADDPADFFPSMTPAK